MSLFSPISSSASQQILPITIAAPNPEPSLLSRAFEILSRIFTPSPSPSPSPRMMSEFYEREFRTITHQNLNEMAVKKILLTPSTPNSTAPYYNTLPIEDLLKLTAHFAKLQILFNDLNIPEAEQIKHLILQRSSSLSDQEWAQFSRQNQKNIHLVEIFSTIENKTLTITTPEKKSLTPTNFSILLSAPLQSTFNDLYTAFSDRGPSLLALQTLIAALNTHQKIRPILNALLSHRESASFTCKMSASIAHESMSVTDRVFLIHLIQDVSTNYKSNPGSFIQDLYDYVGRKLHDAPFQISTIESTHNQAKFLLRSHPLLPRPPARHDFFENTDSHSFFSQCMQLQNNEPNASQVFDIVICLLKSFGNQVNFHIFDCIMQTLANISSNQDKLFLLKELQGKKITFFDIIPQLIKPTSPMSNRHFLLKTTSEILEKRKTYLFPYPQPITGIFDYFHEKITNPSTPLTETQLSKDLEEIDFLLKNFKEKPSSPEALSLLLKLTDINREHNPTNLSTLLIFTKLGKNKNIKTIQFIESLLEKTLNKDALTRSILLFIKISKSDFINSETKTILSNIAYKLNIPKPENISPSSFQLETIIQSYDTLPESEKPSRLHFLITIADMLYKANNTSPRPANTLALLYNMLSQMNNTYHILEDQLLGQGSFGSVKRIYHIIDQKHYAIKIPNDSTGEELKHESTMLEMIEKNRPSGFFPIIRKIQTVIYQQKPALILELHPINLLQMTTQNKCYFPSFSRIRKYTKDLFNALSFLQQQKIVHADIKPANILVSAEKRLILTDFNSAFIEPCPNPEILRQTRYYRSPEYTIGTKEYTYSIDMWSAGCILYELYQKIILFPAQKRELHKWHQQILGPYPSTLLEKSPNKSQIQPIDPTIVQKESIPLTLQQAFDYRKTQALNHLETQLELFQFTDLVMKLLALDPQNRLSANEATSHAFLTEIRLSSPIEC